MLIIVGFEIYRTYIFEKGSKLKNIKYSKIVNFENVGTLIIITYNFKMTHSIQKFDKNMVQTRTFMVTFGINKVEKTTELFLLHISKLITLCSIFSYQFLSEVLKRLTLKMV